jgi:hypothetical protein
VIAPTLERPTQRGSFVAALALVATACALVLAALERDFGADGYLVPYMALVLAFLCLAPAAVRTFAGAGSRPIPFLVLIGSIHAVYYALPALSADRVGTMTAHVDTAGLAAALEVALLGVVALYAGYGLWGAADPRARAWHLDWEPGAALRVALFLLPVGLLAHAATLSLELPPFARQPVHLLASGLQVALGVLFVLARRGHLARGTARVVLFGLVPLLLFTQVADASIGQAVRTGIFFLMLVWGTGGRVPLVLMLVGAVAAITLRGGAEEFRALKQRHPHLVAESPVERAGQFLGLSVARLLEDRGASASDTVLERVSQIALLGHVIELTPDAVPYWNGATYATLPAAFVPRALWPDKPAKELGQTFGHRYGILDADDRLTSVNLPQLVEFHANFGVVGVALGMALLGGFFRWVSDRLNRPGAGDGGIVLAALLFSTLTNIESDLSLVLGTLAQVGLVFWCVLWLARRAARTNEVQRP